MPTTVRIATVALGLSGLYLLGVGFRGVLGEAGDTTLADVAGVLGIVELIVVGRVIERRQTARLLAMGLALLQTLGAVIALAQRDALGIAAIVLAGLIVVPLSNEAAEHFFETGPIG
jgi:hypothetical protein